MIKDLSIEHINAAVNAIGITAKYHSCDGVIDNVGKVPILCGTRADIVEFFDKSGNQRGTLVGPKKIFGWDRTDYRIETVWDIKRIIENHE